MKMRRRLFYILYAIIVLVLFSASVALTHKFKIPAVGSILALFIGYAMSTGRIRTVVEFILNVFEDNYYVD
jgi:hypothetical protein